MPKIFQFTKKDKTGKIKNVGSMEIKNQTDNSADIYFYGDIVSTSYNPDDWWGGGNPEDMAPQDVANFLKELNGMTDINIHVNSGGGDVFAGVAIYNLLKSNSANKTTYVDGLAASAASLIALAGDKIIVPNNAQLMIHNPWTVAMGNANDFRATADLLDQVAKSIINIYMDNVKDGVTEEQIKGLMDEAKWMTGQEAADIFAIQTDEKLEVAAYAKSEFFNEYKNLPKNLAMENPQNNLDNSNQEILKVLKTIENRLNKLENPIQNEPPKNTENKNVNIIKAKLALKCKL